MAVIIQGIDIPKKHHVNCYYIDDDGKVLDVSRKTVVGKAVQIPSAQSERKKGEWILVKGSNGKDYHKCSECLHTQDITGVKNFCAVCGADMRGEQCEKD